MTYAELTAAVTATTAQDFAAVDLARFCTLTEQKVYNAVQIPALRKTVPGTLSIGAAALTVPPDYLYTYELSITLPSGRVVYLLNKDVGYLKEVFPTNVTGQPRVYANSGAEEITLAPAPDAAYAYVLNYGSYPESTVTAGTSWLSENFSMVLLNGMLLEAARFMKEDDDIIKLYDKMFVDAMAQLKQLGDGKLRQDTFRTPQPRVQVL